MKYFKEYDLTKEYNSSNENGGVGESNWTRNDSGEKTPFDRALTQGHSKEFEEIRLFEPSYFEWANKHSEEGLKEDVLGNMLGAFLAGSAVGASGGFIAAAVRGLDEAFEGLFLDSTFEGAKNLLREWRLEIEKCGSGHFQDHIFRPGDDGFRRGSGFVK